MFLDWNFLSSELIERQSYGRLNVTFQIVKCVRVRIKGVIMTVLILLTF